MFYCTIYKVFPNKPDYVSIGTALSYTNRSDAEKFIQYFVDEAKAYGATKIEQKEGYTYVTGNFAFSTYRGGFISYKSPITYILGIETKEDRSLYSLASEEEGDFLYLSGGATQDGLQFEAEVAASREQRLAKQKAEKEAEDKILNNLKTQLDDAEDLKAILKILIKFYKYKINKDLLLNTVIARIQDDSASSNWYDKLSDINS